MMIRPVSLTCLVAAGLLALPSGDARATMITNVFVSGSGGTATTFIDNTSTPSTPTDDFSATFTKVAPIDFTVTIDSPGTFYLTGFFGDHGSGIVNSTGTEFTALKFQLLNPPGNTIPVVDAQQQTGTPLPTLTFPGNFTAMLSGPPNLLSGSSTDFGVGYSFNGTGSVTVTVELTPIVPEPSSVVMTGLGVLALAGYGLRRGRAG